MVAMLYVPKSYPLIFLGKPRKQVFKHKPDVAQGLEVGFMGVEVASYCLDENCAREALN